MNLLVVLGAAWGAYCLFHYGASKQRFDSVMTRRDSLYLVITLVFVGLIF
jgi:hypothetical protein